MQRFKDLLFVVTADVSSAIAYERAAQLAEQNQARLTVVEVIDEVPRRSWTPKNLQLKIIADRQQGLEKLVAGSSKKIEIQTKVLVGIRFIEITREVLRGGHDLVIKMARGDERLDQVFGSDDMHLLRKCPCPVLLLKPQAHKAFRRILATVDVGEECSPRELENRHLLNMKILEIATSLALSESAELHIAHAWRAIGESMMQGRFVNATEKEVVDYVDLVRQERKQELNLLMAETGAKLGQETMQYLKPQTQLLKGYASEEIPDFADKIKADLVVMGTVGRTGISGFIIGNTAETILNRIKCSVLAIKPQGFETPIRLED